MAKMFALGCVIPPPGRLWPHGRGGNFTQPKICTANVQGSAKRWALGCVNSSPAARWSQKAGFTQPRAHLLADPCNATDNLQIGYMYECSMPPIFGKKSLRVPMVFGFSKWSNISFDSVNLSFKLRGTCGSQSTSSVTKFDHDVKIQFQYEVIFIWKEQIPAKGIFWM